MRKIYFLLVMLVMATLSGWAQPWIYDFGTGTGTFTSSNSASTTFLTSTPTNGGTYRVRVSNGQGGGFSLANPGTTLGTGSELQINAPTGASANKFGVYDWTGPTSVAYTKFKFRTTSAGNGTVAFAFGINTLASDNNGYTNQYNNSVAVFSITYSAGAISAVNRRISGSNVLIASSGFTKDADQVVEIYVNNGASSTTYDISGTTYTLATQTWDLWVDGVKISPANGWAKAGTLTTGNISGFGFFLESSTSNAAFAYIDDLEYSNSLPSAPPTNTITTGLVTGAPFTLANCSATASGSVAFTSTGIYNLANVYTAQLSDASGSFAAPLNIGSITSNANSGSINVIIPAATASGTAYKIRVISNDPSITGSASADVSITQNGVCTSTSTDHFRSAVATGNWNQISSWESSPDGSSNWIPATLTPTSAANSITIRNGHNISITTNVTIDQVVVDAGATLTQSSSFTLNNGTGDDLVVNGTMINNSGTATVTGTTILFNSGSLYQYNRGAGAIINATWSPASTVEIVGYTSGAITGFGQTFGNFTWNSTGQTTFQNINTGNFAVQGLLWMRNTGSSNIALSGDATNRTFNIGALQVDGGVLNFTFGGTGIATVNVTGNVVVNGGTVNFGGGSAIPNTSFYRSILNIGGNLTVASGSTFRCSDVNYWGRVVFNKNGTQTFNISTTAIVSRLDYRVLGTSTTQMLSNINIAYVDNNDYDEFLVDGILEAGATAQVTGNGFFTLNGTLRSANINGIGSTGTLAIPSARVTLDPASTVLFNAAGAQTFTSRSDYANVTVDGGGDKTLNGNVTLSGILNLVNGKVVLGANNLVAGNPVSGGNNSNYIKTNGTGILTIRNISNTPVLFPIGNSTYNPVAINDANTLDWSARVEDGINPGSSPFPPDQSVLRTWNITPSAAAAGATVRFYYNDGDATQVGSNYSALANVQVFHYDGSIWTTTNSAQVPTGSPLGNRMAKVSNWTNFSPFAVTNTSESPLPVSLLSFSGYKDGSRNQLSWTTGTEINNRGFDVQRSADGINYTSIGFVNSLATGGNSNDQLSYRFTDNTPAGVKQYYRLRQEDLDGRSKLSNIIMINGARPIMITLKGIYPNPASATAAMIIDAPVAAKLTVLLTDMAGRNLGQQIVNVSEGSNTVALNIASLQSGTYLLRVISENGEVQTGKLVKQ